MRKPYYWKRHGAWYVKSADRKRNIRLSTDQKTAFELWAEMLSLEHADSPTTSVAPIAELYLQSAQRTLEPSTYTGYSYYVASFCNLYGRDLVRNLKPFHVTR